jgi:hypothetical protein
MGSLQNQIGMPQPMPVGGSATGTLAPIPGAVAPQPVPAMPPPGGAVGQPVPGMPPGGVVSAPPVGGPGGFIPPYVLERFKAQFPNGNPANTMPGQNTGINPGNLTPGRVDQQNGLPAYRRPVDYSLTRMNREIM